MEFSTSRNSYSVEDIYSLFNDRLPLVVMVTEGFYGDTADETFNKGEVIVLNAISKQKRVLGYLQLPRKSKLLSIPKDFNEQICIVHNETAVKEDSIARIIEDNALPILVQFPKNKVITMGDKSVSTSDLPPIKLERLFDEVYLLGHIKTEEGVDANITRVPLYLSELRLSPVTGIKASPHEKWTMFFDLLKRKLSKIEYNKCFGNPNIAILNPDAVQDTKFSVLKPQRCSKVLCLEQRQLSRPGVGLLFHSQPVPPGLDQKEKLKHQSRGFKTLPKHKTDFSRPLPSHRANVNRPLPPLPTVGRAEQVSGKETSENNSDEINMYITPSPPTNADLYENADTIDLNIEPSPDHHQSVPNVLDRRPLTKKPTSNINQLEKSQDREHDWHRMYELPFVLPTQDSSTASYLQPVQNQTIKVNTGCQTVLEVEKLSIREVCEYLEILNLGQYCQSFKEQLIDGSLLVGLTETMLTEDFGMKRVEAFRLLKFARESYIPA